MEKSAQRNPKRPSTSNHTDKIPKEVSRTPPPIPTSKAASTTKTTNGDFVTKNKVIQDIPEEVQRAKESRRSHTQVLHDTASKKESESKGYSFDLREAVIQSAILERPYK